MQMTKREILDELLDFMGELGDADARNTADRLLSRVIQTIWLQHPWSDHVMPSPLEIATVANQRTYVLPDHFGRVRPDASMRNLTTGNRIDPIDQNVLEDDYPQAGTTFETAQEPTHFYVAGVQGVAIQPAATGDALEVVSTSALDLTIRVTVEGPTTAGIWTRTTVTLNGITPVAVGTFRNDVLNFSKAYPEGTDPATEGYSSVGSVTLRKVAGAVALETLQPEESAHERRTIVLIHKPDRVYTVVLPFIRAPRRLLADSDEIPRFWGPAVIEEARIEWDYNQGNISLAQMTQIPRPRRMELVQYDNSIRYSSWRTTPFQG